MSTMTKHGCKAEEDNLDTQTVDIVVAEPPFNDADADLILKSSDSVYFYVHKANLLLVSPVFKHMMSNPNQEPVPSQEFVDDCPCVTLHDESVELYQLLSWCDPRGLPIMTLEGINLALKLADKYEMDGVVRRLENTLEALDDIVKANPVQSYALAVRYHLPRLIHKAARYSLTLPVHQFPIVPEFDNVTGDWVQKLYAYHFACSKAAIDYIRSGVWMNEQHLEAFSAGMGLLVPSCCELCGLPEFGMKLKKWFANYITYVEILLSDRPVGAVVLEPSSYRAALEVMSSCQRCRGNIGTFLSLLSLIAEGIDRATKEVDGV